MFERLKSWVYEKIYAVETWRAMNVCSVLYLFLSMLLYRFLSIQPWGWCLFCLLPAVILYAVSVHMLKRLGRPDLDVFHFFPGGERKR